MGTGDTSRPDQDTKSSQPERVSYLSHSTNKRILLKWSDVSLPGIS